MAATDIVRARIDADLKKIRVPNEPTQAALRAAQRGEVARFKDVASLMADLDDDEA